jgi:DNA-binding HxlR family transcriptional regulator
MKSVHITARCPIRTTLELIGGKWKLLIMFQLKEQAQRPSELKKRIPDISEKMLLQELKLLVDSNLVNRINYGEVPPRVEYELTPIGYEALPILGEMKAFADKYEKTLKQK